MTRYFFDVTAETSVQYDYSGRPLPSLDHARELAELIAIDMGCRQGDELLGTEIEVRDATGLKLFTVAVQATATLAA
jgi:hypothetical protein